LGATTTINPPQTILSSTPLSGSFTISCAKDGQTYTTPEIKYNHWHQGIERDLEANIPFLYYKTQVRHLYDFGYYENGRTLAIIFSDLEEDVEQCTIQSGVNDPIQGATPVFESTTLRQYGDGLYFEAVPLEMLFSDVTSPQVEITVNGI